MLCWSQAGLLCDTATAAAAAAATDGETRGLTNHLNHH